MSKDNEPSSVVRPHKASKKKSTSESQDEEGLDGNGDAMEEDSESDEEEEPAKARKRKAQPSFESSRRMIADPDRIKAGKEAARRSAQDQQRSSTTRIRKERDGSTTSTERRDSTHRGNSNTTSACSKRSLEAEVEVAEEEGTIDVETKASSLQKSRNAAKSPKPAVEQINTGAKEVPRPSSEDAEDDSVNKPQSKKKKIKVKSLLLADPSLTTKGKAALVADVAAAVERKLSNAFVDLVITPEIRIAVRSLVTSMTMDEDSFGSWHAFCAACSLTGYSPLERSLGDSRSQEVVRRDLTVSILNMASGGDAGEKPIQDSLSVWTHNVKRGQTGRARVAAAIKPLILNVLA